MVICGRLLGLRDARPQGDLMCGSRIVGVLESSVEYGMMGGTFDEKTRTARGKY